MLSCLTLWREIEVRGLDESVAEGVADFIDVEAVERICVLGGVGDTGGGRGGLFDEVSDLCVELVDGAVFLGDFCIEAVDGGCMP